ncbi:hypothetical protein MHM582_0214 [Microbacterium sp. HM58-2]|nr:hypothetical protein MHM582_0214 [Microbacterium sp. HM58-2]
MDSGGMTHAPRTARPRRTAEQTRRLLIAIAMDLVLTRGVTSGVAHIRLQEVLRIAGLTTGAAYRIWADQEDFQRELAAAVIRCRIDEPTASTREVVCGEGWPEHLDDVIRRGAERHMATFAPENRSEVSSRIFLAALALRATAQASDRLIAASRDRHERSIAEFTAFYAEAMCRYGMRLRGTYTMTQFTTAMAALGEGFALQALEGLEHETVTRSAPGRADESWTLFGAAVAGLVREFFVPAAEDPAAEDPDAEAPAAESPQPAP